MEIRRTPEAIPPRPRSPLQLPQSLYLYLLAMLGFSLLSWVVAYYFHLKGLGHPYSWPYYVFGQSAQHPHGDRYSDLYVSSRFSHFHEMSFFSDTYGFGFLYPAPMALLYRIFLPNIPHAWFAFMLLYVGFVGVCATFCIKSLWQNGLSLVSSAGFVLVSIFLSEVLLFEAQRLNFEFFTFALMSGVFYCVAREKYSLAAVPLGVAISLKLYPFILLGVFLSQKKYRAIAVSIVTAVAVTIVGFAAETPSFMLSVHGTVAGIKAFSHLYAEQFEDAIGWDHSFFALIKLLNLLMKFPIPALLHVYMALAAIAGLTFYFVVVRKLPVLNQLAVLTLASITLPPVSFEYTLLQLYPVFALLCIALARQRRTGADPAGTNLIMFCFGFLFSVQGWLVLRGRTADGPLKSLFLACLLYLFSRVRIPDTLVLRSSTIFGDRHLEHHSVVGSGTDRPNASKLKAI